MTHTVLDRDSNEAVIGVCYEGCQIVCSAPLPVTTAVDPNEDRQIRFSVDCCRCEYLVEFSNGHGS